MMRRLLLACLLLPGHAMAQAQQSTPPTGKLEAATAAPSIALVKVVATDKTRAQALALAQMLNSEALTHNQLERVYSVTMPAALKERAEFQALEKAYPGVSDVAIQAEREIVEPAAIANLPTLHQVIANIYAEYLTADELEVLTTFYASTTGAKALEAAAEGFDMTNRIERNLTDGETTVSGADVQNMTAGSGTKFLGKLDSADRTRLLLFTAAPAGRKWRAIQPEVFAAVAAQANTSNEGIMAKASQHVLEAVTAFIQAADKTAPAKKSAGE